MNDAYLLLGSSLGSRELYLHDAKNIISEKVGEVVQSSSLYETAPWGSSDTTPFLNQVIQIQTQLLPEKLLSTLLEIEKALGRTRGNIRNEPRTIDIDILYYGDLVINQQNLTIPHERLHQRRFVLTPLAEIAPELLHPVLKMTNARLLEICEDTLWVKKID
ncbi:MAG TPA: 2-amino-4-hydroxy-6-hydroxymethyldihydropteridine diphosphokinase [Lentimicrobium sp.]|jgi:2-amino-4-hydroxy-6-hydroxymethyldihydropteridine diphosphokinase|nr:2-amino-4-hydroxy-6-hydroxymethyldihydropteridine diphosphokinase [Lentimicrobium sp.]